MIQGFLECERTRFGIDAESSDVIEWCLTVDVKMWVLTLRCPSRKD